MDEEEIRDRPRCPVCHWRHDPPWCEEDPDPGDVEYVGTTLNGDVLWNIRGGMVFPRRKAESE